MEDAPNQTVATLLANIAASGAKLALDESGARKDIITQAFRLITALETPTETVNRLVKLEPGRYAAVRIAIDLKIFDTLAAESGRAKTVQELCVPKDADLALVSRITRNLAATGVIHEVESEVYASTPFSKALTMPQHGGGIKFCFDSSLPSFAAMPSYFAKNGFKSPTDPINGPFQNAHGPGHAFGWLGARPDLLAAFQAYVYAQRLERPSWTDEGFYPVRERLIEGMSIEGDRSALVDVGGGVGHCLGEFRVSVPEWKGRLVLQEDEMVAKQAVGLDESIEVMAYDFFTPQPVIGARAYYLRNILHDWPDHSCRDILNHLKSAMEPGYSKLLLNEIVIADQGAAWQHTAMDMHMMSLAASQERTESQWRELIASVGLKITGIWVKGEGNESIIEIVN